MRFEQLDTHVIWARIFEGILFKIDFKETMYWVLDGLDESDTPLSFIPTLFNARPKSPLRILLLSRPSPNLMNLALSKKPFLTNFQLTEGDTRDDIRLYIRTRVQEGLPLEDDVKEHISGQMFEKASGSFLWAKLALNSLEQSWHTEDDIRRALGDIPEGMQSLYGRMLNPIQALRIENPRNYVLASRILSWVTCAEEPLTPHELAVALEPEFTKLQNLQATISHLCGHFLVTSDTKIMPIHETARSFLLTHRVDEMPFLDGATCHEHLATVCINYMCSDSWRTSLIKIEKAGSWSNLVSHNRLSLFLSENRFLRYAVCHWAYHVSHASPEYTELLSLLHGFFDEYILTWIHACVVVADLRVITKTAQHIKAYGKKQKSSSILDSPASLGRRNAQFFQSWATDLIRMVGRFGRNLVEKPSSIYKIIPPMCPHGSQIYTTYAPTSNLAVHGISSDVWDDCVARLPIGEERTISRILSGVTYFVCLLAVGGDIIVCRSETFEEARRMHHGEYVTHMTINKSGDLLVTAGIDTFRIWELSTGEEVHRIPKGKSAMTMTIAFGSVDTELIVAYDDRSVVCYDVGTQEVVWDFLAEEESDEYHSCPREMVLSPDQTKIAVDVRGRPVVIWDLEAKAEGPRHCMRAGDREAQDQFCAPVDSTRWHPDGLSVLVLFQDTLLARFFLTDEETVETLETGAKDMVVNHDGSLLLTSNYAGTLSLWSLPQFNLAYRLHYEQFVRDLAFSPDGQRFYDVRGPLCNVWEPDVLLRADQEDPEEISNIERRDTCFSDPVFAADDTVRSQITAVVSSPSAEQYVCGKDDGTVSLYETNTGKRIRKLYSHSNTASIITIAWSPTRKYVASCDDLGRIVIKRLEVKVELHKAKWAVFPALDIRDDEPVNQFVFNTNRKLVLMSFAGSDRIWNLKKKSQVWRRNRSAALPIRWIQHPAKDNLLCVQHDRTTIHDWDAEGVQTSGSAPAPSYVGSDGDAGEDALQPREHTGGRVRHVVQSDDRRHIISEVLPLGPRSKCSQLEILATDDMLAKETGQSIKGKVLTNVSKHVRRLLGCYKNQVVFLDHQYWVCTWPLGQASGTPRMHFFLPRDCIGPSAIPLVALATGPTILFPKNGEMTVVRNGIKI
jgi:WD40 repeat protein